MKNHIEKSSMYADAAVVVDKAKSAEAIHKERYTFRSGADDLRQAFLCDLGNQPFRFPWLAKLRH